MTFSANDLHDEEVALSAIATTTNKGDQVALLEGLRPEYFTGRHVDLFKMFRKMYLNGEDINIVSLAQNHKEEFESLHLPFSIFELSDRYANWGAAFSSVDAIKSYDAANKADLIVKRLQDKFECGKIEVLMSSVMDMLNKGKLSGEIYTYIEGKLADRTATGVKRTLLKPFDMASLMVEATSERMDEEKRKKDTIYTSYRKFNEFTGGLERGDLVILSAASGSGKSAFAINLVRDTAYVDHKGVLYLNSEMSDKQQARRYASMLAQVSHSAIRNGTVKGQGDDRDEMGEIIAAADKFSKSNIYTMTIPDLQLANVVTSIKRMREVYQIDLVVVDYIGRMDTITNQDASEWQIMEHAARTLKTVAQEENIVVIMVAQLAGNGQTLAKASSMKNEADLWLNLQRFTNQQRIEMSEHGAEIDEVWNTYLEFRKARNVEGGKKILMHFHGDTLTFTDDYEKARRYTMMERAEEQRKREEQR